MRRQLRARPPARRAAPALARSMDTATGAAGKLIFLSRPGPRGARAELRRGRPARGGARGQCGRLQGWLGSRKEVSGGLRGHGVPQFPQPTRGGVAAPSVFPGGPEMWEEGLRAQAPRSGRVGSNPASTSDPGVTLDSLFSSGSVRASVSPSSQRGPAESRAGRPVDRASEASEAGRTQALGNGGCGWRARQPPSISSSRSASGPGAGPGWGAEP